ncbi:FecR family protein [Chitinophaga niabensis]|uniref:FecR protein n=1 Tax=Chitinophaga niabensis TaxID=536979 RepID=A0A1N6J173_9BACT|nr:FecR family protein [Chitinophaga niabensis]SIO38007.1 FecR protein [Chitinophaga niabensis]
MLRERMQYLLDRYFQGICTEEEKQELARGINDLKDDELLKQLVGNSWERFQPTELMPVAVSERIQAAVFPVEEKVRPVWSRKWMAVAASLLLIVSAGLFFIKKPGQLQQKARMAEHTRYKNEVPAGGNKALLTLGDGTVIELDSAANGLLTQQGNARIIKLPNGQLAYEMNDAGSGEVMFNTMRTPRGGEYRLQLPDGSKVWLNAASSITYPNVFTGDTRSVEITGEAYFEVAKDAARPFKVQAGNMKVEVLGTHFNINAYPGEPVIRTTLLEGAVRIQDAIMKPGQQASLAATGQFRVEDDVETDEVMAWKNGFFQFNDADMPTVMRQLENWYDITVTYEGRVPQRSFGGAIQRSLPLSKVLDILEENNVRFKIEGRNITVMK